MWRSLAESIANKEGVDKEWDEEGYRNRGSSSYETTSVA